MKTAPDTHADPQMRSLADHLTAAQASAQYAAAELCRCGDPYAVHQMVSKANQIGAMIRWLEQRHGIKRG